MKVLASKNSIKELLRTAVEKRLNEYCSCETGNVPIIGVLKGELPSEEEQRITIPHSGPPIEALKDNNEENNSAPKIKIDQEHTQTEEEKLRNNIRLILIK